MESTNLVKPTKWVNWNLMTFIMFWTGMVVLCSLYVTIPLLTIFEKEFAVTPNQAAWVGSIFSIFFAIGCVFFGIMSERFGLKRVMVVGLSVLALITFIVGAADSFHQLLLFRALQGLICATFSPVAITYINTIFPEKKRGTTLGFLSTGFLLAGIVGQLVGSYIEPRMSWHAVFTFFAIVYMITALLLMQLPMDSKKKNKNVLSIVKKFKIPFQQKPIVITYFISITILLTFVGMYTALGGYLSQNFHFTFEQIFFVRAIGGIAVIISLFTGKLANNFGVYRVVYAGFILTIMGLFTMGFSQSLILTITMSVVFVAGIATVVPTLLSIVGQLDKENKGIVTSLYTFILFIGASLGPILSTSMMKFSVNMPFIIFAVILCISLMLTWTLHMLVVKKEQVEQGAISNSL
ncbi:MFS transporter [Niallia sp. Krafla_26]|uniref:MFS transporter n=1 Tax=Niallia sp. Krafla_26 TaxID=3064703 RepID=UPI003D164354